MNSGDKKINNRKENRSLMICVLHGRYLEKWVDFKEAALNLGLKKKQNCFTYWMKAGFGKIAYGEMSRKGKIDKVNMSYVNLIWTLK